MSRKALDSARPREDGAVLIFALIIITAIALVVGTLLTRGAGSLMTTVALRNVAGSSYSADAAATVAINDLREGYGFTSANAELGFNNNPGDGLGCFGNSVGVGGTDALSLAGFYPATGSLGPSSAYVECTGEAGTGQEGSPVPINNSNKPGYAIITLNGPITSSAALDVHGGIYSNSTVTGSGTVYLDAGDAWAYGTCNNVTVSSTATKHCSTNTRIPDPNDCSATGQSATCHGYDPNLAAVPALQNPPTSCSSGVATFTPGYYDDAAALNTATALCAVAWFQPGDYYFDFHNDGCATVCPSNLFTTGSNDVWNVPAGTTVIGGTPTDSSGNVLAQPPSNPTLPGACESPVTSTSAVGVQFVFGYNSGMHLTGGSSQGAHMELCGTYHATQPPIEFYGLKTGSTPTSATASPLKATGSGWITTGPGTWTNTTSSALDAGGAELTWTTTGNGTKTGSVTIPGFVPSTTIPAGSVLTGATLHITHQENDTATTATVQVTGAGTATPAITIPLRTSSSTDNLDLTTAPYSTVFAALQKQVHTYGFGGAKVVLNTKITSNGNNSDSVDAMTLDLTYYAPVLRGESGTCIDGTGTPCKLLMLDNSGNNKILMYLQGTTYAPYGDIDITLSNFSAEVAKFGLVARQVEFNINNGNPRYTGPVFEIPDNSPGYGYDNSTVDLKVHLCLGSATVTASCRTNTPALAARVQLWDPTGSPVKESRQVTVLSWNHTN